MIKGLLEIFHTQATYQLKSLKLDALEIQCKGCEPTRRVEPLSDARKHNQALAPVVVCIVAQTDKVRSKNQAPARIVSLM